MKLGVPKSETGVERSRKRWGRARKLSKWQGEGTKMQAYVAVQRKLLILIWALWRKNEAFDPDFGQNKMETSGNDGSKFLFSLGSEGGKKQLAPADAKATQDELPYNESPEVLFSLLQS